MTRCSSTCKYLPKNECNPPRCVYNNGEHRHFCRLSYKYKMVKPSCRITRKYKKGESRQAAETKIGEFIGRSHKVLQMICSHSGECLALGKKMAELNALFQFSEFKYAVGSIRPLGAPSANGFVREIVYERKGYNAHAILKSSMKEDADNLMYEYLVGHKYINRVMTRFPCFVETYGLFYYKSPIFWETMKESKTHSVKLLESLEPQTEINYSKACENSKYASILIQHLTSCISVEDVIENHFDVARYDLLYMLFIIYHALSSLSKTFTHYDLHMNNVLLYRPGKKEQFIQYQYHMAADEIITFCSPFLPKIIDYGRSFFDNGNTNSKKIYHKMCADCNDCGDKAGFQWLDPKPYLTISSSKKNESHDLRLLNELRSGMSSLTKKTATAKALNHLVKSVKYGVSLGKYYKSYGTKEDIRPNETKIMNVTSAFMALKKAVGIPEVIRENAQRYTVHQIGVLHIYEDGRPMEFIHSS